MTRSRKRKRRKGATAVEFAIVAPIILLLFFAAFEFSRMNMVRHTVDVAAYEGARRGILPGATVAGVRSRVDEVLADIGVVADTVDIQPETINGAAESVTVNISVALDDHTWVPASFTQGGTISGSCTLMRERF